MPGKRGLPGAFFGRRRVLKEFKELKERRRWPFSLYVVYVAYVIYVAYVQAPHIRYTSHINY